MPPGKATAQALFRAFRPGRLVAFSVLFIALTVAGSYAVYAEFAGRSFSLDGRMFRGSVLAAVATLLLLYFAADALRLHFTLRALGHPVPLRRTTGLVFVNLLFSNVTPMATGGGFAQIWFLRRSGVPLGTATAATTVRTLLAVAFIFTAAPLSLFTMDAFDGSLVDRRLLPLFTTLAAAYLAFFAVAVWRTRWLLLPFDLGLGAMRALRLLAPARHRRWRFTVRREMVRFGRAFRAYLAGPRRDVALSILWTAIFLLSLFSFPALLLWALGYAVDYVTVLGLLVVTTLVMYFSPTPGASGIAEGVFGHFFAGLVTANHLVLVTVAWRFLTIFLGMFVGVAVTQFELMRTAGGGPSARE